MKRRIQTMKARLIQRKDSTFHAYIDNEGIYAGLKSGRLAWDDHKKSQITHYVVPASIFERLLELDKKNDTVTKEAETIDSSNG
jgi:hypothetical protein